MAIARVVVLAFVLSACSTAITLTDRGSVVTEVGASGMPDGCTLIGDVSIGIPPDAGRPGTEAELVILMRNKAGQLGGSHVLVESRHREDDGGGAGHWIGRGRAYWCEGGDGASTAPAEATSGNP